MQYQPPIQEESRYYCAKLVGATSFHRHWHYEIEVLYCTNGWIQVEIGKELCTAKAGEALLVGSSQVHSIITSPPDAHGLILEFGTSLLGGTFPTLAESALPHKTDHPALMEILARIFALVDTKDPADLLERQGLMLSLSALLLWDLAKPGTENSRLRHFQRADGIGQVLAYIPVAYREPITLDEAARIAQYEKKSFCRVFKTMTGMTFHQYLNAYRIEQACRLFREGANSISEVGQLCGISQTQSFSRLFRQHTGMTPSEYIQTFCQP